MSDPFHKHPIIFYNVENLFDTVDDVSLEGNEDFTPDGDKFWDEERYRAKLNSLVKALLLVNGATPLAFGMAEIENRRVVEDLIHTGVFAQRNYKIVHFDSEDRRGMDCAFVYDERFLQPEVETRLLIQVEDEPYFRTRDILYIRGKIANLHTVHFFVNHWPSRREGISESENRRKSAATTLRREIDKILNVEKDANILVMGDFNDTPEDYSIRAILRAKGQHEQSKGDLVNLLIEEQKKGLGTTVHQREWDVFDQLIVSQGLLQGQSGLQIEGNNAFIAHRKELVFTFKDGGQKPSATYGGDTYHGGYSDHLPVYLNLKEK
ncbi:Endonuclease/Exonuclease/phosphatase family protein [compost metagenome]